MQTTQYNTQIYRSARLRGLHPPPDSPPVPRGRTPFTLLPGRCRCCFYHRPLPLPCRCYHWLLLVVVVLPAAAAAIVVAMAVAAVATPVAASATAASPAATATVPPPPFPIPRPCANPPPPPSTPHVAPPCPQAAIPFPRAPCPAPAAVQQSHACGGLFRRSSLTCAPSWARARLPSAPGMTLASDEEEGGDAAVAWWCWWCWSVATDQA